MLDREHLILKYLAVPKRGENHDLYDRHLNRSEKCKRVGNSVQDDIFSDSK